MHKKKYWIFIVIGILLVPLPNLLIKADIRWGWFGGGPGNANIGLGLIGLAIWAVSLFLLLYSILKIAKNN
jgi:hypothetical protein